MAPLKTSTSSGGNEYSLPHLGDSNEKISVLLDVSALYDTDLIDSKGYVKPGAVFRYDSGNKVAVPVDGADQTAYGISLAAVKVADDAQEATLNAAQDFEIVLLVGGTFDRALIEGNLGRALTANELTAIANNDRLVITDPQPVGS